MKEMSRLQKVLALLVVLGVCLVFLPQKTIAAEQLEVPQKVWWDDWMACCNYVDNATGYEFQLYKGNTKVGKAIKTSKPYCNFANQLAKCYEEEGVTFKVRALYDGQDIKHSNFASDQFKDWTELKRYCQNNGIILGNTSGQFKDERNYEYTRKEKLDGDNIPGKWKEIEGELYFYQFGELTSDSKIAYDGYLYYLQEDGKMATGWTDIEGKTYYFNDGINSSLPIGAALSGLYEIEGEDYWFYRYSGKTDLGKSFEFGEMAKDLWIRIIEPDGSIRIHKYMDSTGKCTQTKYVN